MSYHYPLPIACPMLVLSSITFQGQAYGQVLTAPELLPQVGSSYHHYVIADAIPWDTITGLSAVWDYSWISVDSLNDVTYSSIAADEAPDIGDYPGADRVIRSIAGTNDDYVIDRFYDEQADRLVELGSVGPVLSYAFDMPETIYGLPMQMEGTVPGTYCFWSDGLGIQYHFCGESRVTFDAMGSLILPFGTYADVKHVTHWSSSFETTGPATDSTYTIRQQWFAPGIPYPLLDLSIYIDGVGQIWPNGRIMDLASITGMEGTDREMAWSIHPNPSAGLITIDRMTSSEAMIEVRTLDGRLVHSAAFAEGSVTRTVSIDHLADGIYLVHLVRDGSSTARRLLKASR